MGAIGPELPPHLQAKRKHDGDNEGSQYENEDASRAAKPQPVSDSNKRRRVAGPAPPPALLEERPPGGPEKSESESDSSDDDEYGPTLPAKGSRHSTSSARTPDVSAFDELPKDAAEEKVPTKRDEWMMLPPKQDDLSARMDPTKIRARGFNTGKSARTQKGGANDNATWTETPEQKRKRLENEVLGIKPASSEATPEDWKERAKKLRDEEKAKQIGEHNSKNRSQSLYDKHKHSQDKEETDDASKRGFNYEKDMSAVPTITHAQKREMLNKAADFGSRFSKGSYL